MSARDALSHALRSLSATSHDDKAYRLAGRNFLAMALTRAPPSLAYFLARREGRHRPMKRLIGVPPRGLKRTAPPCKRQSVSLFHNTTRLILLTHDIY